MYMLKTIFVNETVPKKVPRETSERKLLYRMNDIAILTSAVVYIAEKLKQICFIDSQMTDTSTFPQMLC